jgi:hypothetical protein
MIVRALVASFLALAVVSGDPRKESKADPYEQHIFFAILEGLYADGVSNEVVDEVVAIDPVTKYPANFVWACPACMPAYNAFLAYRARPGFRGYKLPRDTFGAGLAPEVASKLTSDDLQVRQGELEKLIRTWMERRMENLRLTDEERREWRSEMEMRRKEGMGHLDSYRKIVGSSYASMKTCPICEGAN